MYSCASVPSGVTPFFIASQTLEVPAKYCGTSRLSVAMTSSCQASEKRRRVPKSEILKSSAGSTLRTSAILPASRRRPSARSARGWVWRK